MIRRFVKTLLAVRLTGSIFDRNRFDIPPDQDFDKVVVNIPDMSKRRMLLSMVMILGCAYIAGKLTGFIWSMFLG